MKGWHKKPEPCLREYSEKCKCCGQVKPDGKMIRCKGRNVMIDNSQLAPQFSIYYRTQQRIEVEFCDENGKTYDVKRGTIGKTTGWKPVYILMLRRDSISSPYTLGKADKVKKIIS